MRVAPSLETIRLVREAKELTGDFAAFVRAAFPIAAPGATYVHGRHIEVIGEHLQAAAQGKIRRLLINIPPRHMKSLLAAVLWPAFVWASRPEKRFLFASYAKSLSVRDSSACRRLVQSPWMRDRFGDVFSILPDQNRKDRFENNQGGMRLAVSVGSAVTGEGGDFVVVDDPHNAVEAWSKTKREHVYRWFSEALSTRLNNPDEGVVVVIMQRLHGDDLAGRLLERGGFEHLRLPAEYDGKRLRTTLGEYDFRTEPGDPLWPQRFHKQALAELKIALGSQAAAGQLQQNPAPESGGVFKLAWWRYDQSPPDCPVRIQSWDTAYSTKDSGAYSVGQTWGVSDKGFHLIDQLRERLDFPDLIRAVRSCFEKHRPQLVLIEDKASGQSLVQTLVRETLLPVKPVRVGKDDKLTRAHAVSPLVEAGRVHLPQNAPFLPEFLDELSTFPASANADQTDALTQALAWLAAHNTRTRPTVHRR